MAYVSANGVAALMAILYCNVKASVANLWLGVAASGVMAISHGGVM